MNETNPEELGVMVLPGTMLFPHTLLPLYIFEPRFQLMLEHALEAERTFAIGTRRPDAADDTPFAVGGAGVVRACVRNADGTANLILQGVKRVRFVGWTQIEPYRIARVMPLSSSNPSTPATAQLAALVKELCDSLADAGVELPGPFAQSLGQIVDADTLSDAAASALIADPELRRQLFEELDVPTRLKGLMRCLRAQLDNSSAGS